MISFKKNLSALSFLFLLIFATPGESVEGRQPSAGITSISQLNDSSFTIAASENGPFAEAVKKDLPKANIIYLDGHQAREAVKVGKADAYAAGLAELENAIAEGLTGVKILPGSIGNRNEIAVGISRASKIPDIKKKINEFISELKASGTLHDMYGRWVINKDFNMPEINVPSQAELKIKVGTVGLIMPFSFYAGKELTGFDIELAKRFAAWLGAGLELQDYDFGGVVAAAASGKIDCIMAYLVKTPERAEKIDFSDVLFAEEIALLVRDEETQASDPNKEFDGKRIGVFTGSIHAEIVKEVLPSAELFYFDNNANAVEMLLSGKIDAIVQDDSIVREIEKNNPLLTHIEEYLKTFDNAFIFAKTPESDKIRNEINEFIRSIRSDGTLDKIAEAWLGSDKNLRTLPDYENYPDINGVLKIALDDENAPFSYVQDRRIVGYDVDIIARFCKAMGYRPKISAIDFSAVIPSVMSGKSDIGIGAITITPERAESVNFSDPVYTGGSILLTMKQKSPAGYEYLAGKRIAVLTGSTHPDITLKFVPTAKLVYFDSAPDTFTALRTGKVDAVCAGIPAAKLVMAEDDSIEFFGEQLTHTEGAPIFAKTENGRKLCNEFSEFLKAQWDNGTIKEIDSIWFGSDKSRKIIKDYSKLPAPNGVLKMAADVSIPPCTYVKDNMIVGYDIDCAVRFCEAYGYGLEIVPMNFNGVIPAVQTGKCDFGMGGITRTDEREESVLFSYPNMRSGNSFVVKKSGTKPSISGSISISKFEDLAGKRIAVQTGTTHPGIAQKFAPEAILNYFENQTDVFTALKAGKVDVVCTSDLTARYISTFDDSYAMLGDRLTYSQQAPVFPKTKAGEKLCAQFSEFNKKLWEDGTIQEIDSIWFGKDESKRVVKDYSKFPAPNGVLRMATDLSIVPFAYMKNNQIVGYDVDCAARFCEAYGYGLEVVPMSFGAIIPALQSGKCDFAACIVTYTEERAQQVLYAYPNVRSGVAFYVLKSNSESQSQAALTDDNNETPTFTGELNASFKRTFLREDRYKLFIYGIMNTLIITVLSIIFGTVLGFAVYLSCRGGNLIANLMTRFFVWLIRGMPMVVFLMILYYIVFGKVDIAGIWVAVIAFTCTFGSGVYGMLVSGVKAIDNGQLEAAYALGFTDRKAFFTIILPQAALHFMPSYKGEVVALIKATAIVGYIAVQDLTKMGDIVRSRTYEAFFPLIAVAVIYFILAGILNIIVGIIHNKIRPEKRTESDILRGIEIEKHD